jgi:hypothetical protein
MTVDHVLTRCPKLATLREEIGPNGTEVVMRVVTRRLISPHVFCSVLFEPGTP